MVAWRSFDLARQRLIFERSADYTRELLPIKRAARAQGGVAIDSEVFTAAERDRLAYFNEAMAVDGGRHALVAKYINDAHGL